MEWIRLDFENVTGRMGYAQMYQRTINLKLLDPVGAVVEDWEIQGAWIQDANYGDLDYSTSDPVDISLVGAILDCTIGSLVSYAAVIRSLFRKSRQKTVKEKKPPVHPRPRNRSEIDFATNLRS